MKLEVGDTVKIDMQATWLRKVVQKMLRVKLVDNFHDYCESYKMSAKNYVYRTILTYELVQLDYI